MLNYSVLSRCLIVYTKFEVAISIFNVQKRCFLVIQGQLVLIQPKSYIREIL